MSVNSINIKKVIKAKLDNATSVVDVAKLISAYYKLGEVVVNCVPTFYDLPKADVYKRQIYLVESENIVYWSDGNRWTQVVDNNATSLWGWGDNGYQQLKSNPRSDISSPVSLIDNINNKQYKWTQVSAGNVFSLALSDQGVIYSWGGNSLGELGDNTTVDKVFPVIVSGGFKWTAMAAGHNHSVAIRSDGTAWCWGQGALGRLGNYSDLTNRSSPVSVVGGFTWKQVSASQSTCMAIKSDGTLWGWGFNSLGQLGTNDTSSYSSPVSVVGGFTWKQVDARGDGRTIAIRSDDTAWSWGANAYGQLGNNDGTVSSRSSPVSVVGGFIWKQVSAGLYHSTALKTDGTLWSWGANGQGRLGDNSTTSRSSPVSVVGGFTWKFVESHWANMAIRSDDTLWGWGENINGNLGVNNTTSYSSPVSVLGGYTWKSVSARQSVLAIRYESH